MSIREFIIKLQNLPENKKLIIMWAIVAVLGLVMGFFWVTGVIKTISNFKFKL